MTKSKQFRAGAGMVDITPSAGVHLSGSGMGEHRPAQSVLDPLYVRALALECDGQRLCIVVLDTCIVTDDFTDRIRRAAQERFGYEPDQVMMHALQIHSAPSCGRFMLDPDFPLETTPQNEHLWGSEARYVAQVEKSTLEAISQATASLQPVRIGFGSGIRGDLAFNRRGITRQGTIAMPWPVGRRAQLLGPTYLRYMEGPIDPEVGVLAFRSDDLKMVALLLHYTCHPVNVFANQFTYRAVSADWPGAWCNAMQEAYGPECIPIVLNGCCGNINPWDPYDPDYIPDHRRMGAAAGRHGVPDHPYAQFRATGQACRKTRSCGLAVPRGPEGETG